MQTESSQDRRLVKTSTPGIYKRGSSSYVVRYRDPRARDRKRFARTLAEARDLKAQLGADLSRGEYRERSKVTFEEYAEAWLDTYQGRTSRGIRPETIEEYRRDLHRDAVPFFGRVRLAAIDPPMIKEYATHIGSRGPACRTCSRWPEDNPRRRTCKTCAGKGRMTGRVAPGTVRLALAPVRAMLATAFEEGLIRSNPAAGVRIAQRVEEHADAERAKALTEDELRALVEEMPEEWKLLVEFLAQTGLRISEALALRWSEIDLGRRRVLVRRRLRGGSFGPPKSRYGRRDVPLSTAMAQRLWAARAERKAAEDAPVFATSTGSYLDAANLFGRVFKPAARRAGVPWAGFHTLRHTCATILFRRGLNAKQVQVWLGHHSPAFTLGTYVHLLSDDLPDADLFDVPETVISARELDTLEAESGEALIPVAEMRADALTSSPRRR
jgi:integrase